ncbi:glycerol-3-phosphate dehydrogenase/oxidase [Oscillatoriales cyanobacterium LEGE 11467]|uniref:Glycerol-3-phosphate dehydrogenase/oxidase n=1 Tax=Zarconia navalis LEGE 11467 TaxID=1828826 RepID=A0A928VVY2_9CYAN|nr:glycerol-3-phosphate dehydrogenase/oxidase [Zarconia navalis]MBE9040514.1 glycerol-3-phosphate dehydrogenase/oxidase [Zarconia navalis LEGE 11467]
MKRNLAEFTKNVFDLTIVGGGIYGACVAWEASLRGLSVALVEKEDFGGATSANSLKIIHGGLRYLQNADFKRMRESIRERTTLMRIAPPLIHPLPILLPTYGHGIKGKEALSIALTINDLISFDRNDLQDRQKHIPRGRVISKQECQKLVPGIATENLTGAAIFHDAQVYNSERLTLAFVRSAADAGATVANYVKVTGFLQTEDKIQGVQVEDTIAGNKFEIRSKAVINTSGPWLNRVLGLLPSPPPEQAFAKAMNLVLRRPLFDTYAVGLNSSSDSDPDAIVKKGSRMLFVAPWRGRSMVGTAYNICDRDPDNWNVTEAEIADLLAQINQAYLPAKLTREDVAFVHGGLLPQSGISQSQEPIFAKHYKIEDYTQAGYQGLFSVTGVKYTTARDVAQKVIDRLFGFWGQTAPPSKSATTPLYGGDISDTGSFLQQAIDEKPSDVDPETIKTLVYNYGCAYTDMLSYGEGDTTQIIKAQVCYAVREEMARKLSDVIFRRTELGSAGSPGAATTQLCAKVMAKELDWSQSQIDRELKLNLTPHQSFV